MNERRWQPPPMEPEKKSKVTVDEKVVRKMLVVNPTLRKGRTTFQVKKALERGEGIVAREAPSDVALSSGSSTPATASLSRELGDTIDFFVRGKAERWKEKLAAFAAERKAVDEAQEQARTELRGQIESFISLLDDKAVAVAGRAALAKHAVLLKELGLTPQSLLDAARKGKR